MTRVPEISRLLKLYCNFHYIVAQLIGGLVPHNTVVIFTKAVIKISLSLTTYLDNYSKTSNNGPSEKRTTSVQQTTRLPPIDFTIEILHFEPPRSGHLSTPNNGH